MDEALLCYKDGMGWLKIASSGQKFALQCAHALHLSWLHISSWRKRLLAKQIPQTGTEV